MAVKKCCVENCKSCSTRKEDKGVTFHKFPKDATSRNEWQFFTRFRHTQKDLAAYYVCSRHFCKGDFQKNKDLKYRLKSDAVPSIFPWNINTLKMDASEIEESVNSSINDDHHQDNVTDLSSSSKGSEVENLEAIKKFIEDQDRHIQEKELQDKNQQEKKSEHAENIKEPTDNVDSTKDDNKKVASSVMDMILSESEANLAATVSEESKVDVPKPTLEENEKNDQKIISPNEKGSASMSLSVGSQVEVKDFGGEWYAAEVAEVDYDEMEVLVRYEINLKKHDEWINVSSPRLRPFTGTATKSPALTAKDESEPLNDKALPSKDKTPASKEKPTPKEKVLPPKDIKEEPKEDIVKLEEKQKVVFEVGERCLARWRDNRRFVATIQKDLGDGKFEIIFDDGFHWTCTIARLHKMKGDILTIDTSFQSSSAGSPSPLEVSGPSTSNAPNSPSLPPFHTHLFDPSRDYLGSKSERREKKRKLNIKEIFNIGQKKTKIQKTDKETSSITPAEKKQRVVTKKVAPKEPRVVPKKVVKTEIPDAVASIIGTVTKELEIKLEPIPEINEKRETAKTTNIKNDGPVKPAAFETEEAKRETDVMAVDELEPVDCVVNPNDETLDDEDMEEMKPDDLVFEEERLQNFEKLDTIKHEEVIDKIKEAIFKLEGGIYDMEKTNSPKVERVNSPIKDLINPGDLNITELNHEANAEYLKEILAEVAVSVDVGDSNTDRKEIPNTAIEEVEDKSKVSKSKREHSKIKKGKKLRLLKDKKVDKEMEKVRSELEEMKRQFELMRKHIYVRTQEAVQSPDNAPSPESCLLPGEWCCRWVNGQPVGKVSELEGVPHADNNNKRGLPRRSVEVEDNRLPPGWTKHMVRRSVGNSAGKWNVVLVSSEELGNKRFHTKSDMRNFLENYPDESLKPYEYALMDFGVHLKIARRIGWIVNTPDGITEAPATILPANATSHLSPLIKRKTVKTNRSIVKEKKRGLMKEKKRRPIKLKLQRGLHSYNSQIISGEPGCEIKTDPLHSVYEPLVTPFDDGSVHVGSLKVQVIDNLLRCPAEDCLKNFRTKTLLQMHIKHYHRELRAKMGSTPKVLDLAYARTMPNEPDLPQIDKKVIKVKINKPQRREEQKMPLSDSEMSVDSMPTTPVKIHEDTAPILPRIPRSQDSPKLRQALIHKPVKRPRVLLPVRRLEPEQAVSDSMNDDDFQDHTTEPVVDVPTLEHPLDFETAISTHTVTKPLEKKKKGDKKKSFASFSKNISEDEEWFAMNSDDLDTRSSFPCSGSPDSKMDIKMAPMSSESNDDQKDPNLYAFTDTGERVKIVHMKREEIINCHCGFREEDGLMVQCELCLCWQHALCHNIQKESEVPEKYTCSICLNPRRGRRSRRFLHDQDRLYEGLLPGAKPCDMLRRSHELAGNLIRIHDALHALRVKAYVATKKDHPKLYLWAKDWEQAEISYTQEKLNSDYSDLNIMINGIDKENHPVKHEDDGMDIRTPPSEDHDSDRLSQRDNQLGSQSLLSGLLSSPGGASIDLPISTSELERLAKSVQESAEWQRVPPAPQPEAAIENGACRERLLKHIQRCQAVIDTRLDSIEAQVAELESQDPSFSEHYDTAEFYPRTKQTIQMLMRDLDTMEELGVIT